MIFVYYISLFFLGASLTSFANLFAERRRRGEDWIFKRSHCIACGSIIPIYGLIPVFGYFLCGGYCSCGDRIPIFHPLTECIGGMLCIFVYKNSSSELFQLLSAIAYLGMYFLTLEDIRYREVYTKSLAFYCLLFFISLYMERDFHLLSGLFLFVLMGTIYKLFSQGVGEGDIYYSATLAAGIDSIWKSYLFFTISFCIAAIFGGFLRFLKITRSREFPMYPFFFVAYGLVRLFFQ